MFRLAWALPRRVTYIRDEERVAVFIVHLKRIGDFRLTVLSAGRREGVAVVGFVFASTRVPL